MRLAPAVTIAATTTSCQIPNIPLGAGLRAFAGLLEVAAGLFETADRSSAL